MLVPDGTAPYTGRERSVAAASVRSAASAEYFRAGIATAPPGATPIVDDTDGTVVGFRRVVGGNIWIYDLTGRVIRIDEPGLGTPLIDPIDLVLIVGGLGRAVVRGLWRAGTELIEDAAAKAATRVVSTEAISALRVALSRLALRELRFTETTAARMADPARFVPATILRLAVRYGVRDADPQGVSGAFRYTITMFKGARQIGGPVRQYTLRLIVRESDWTVLHFHYQ